MQGQFNQNGHVWSNLQVQVNGVRRNSTVSHVNVCHTVVTNDPANQRGVAKFVIGSLNLSIDNNSSYDVDGTAP